MIQATASGSGQVEQAFIFSGVVPGTYTLEITKAEHTNFTVRNVVVGSGGLDFTKGSREEIQAMTLRCGDINSDGEINVTDLNILWKTGNYNKGAASAADPSADLNGDGDINVSDLNILWNSFNYNKGEVIIDYSNSY
jgi:hypothetical protein